MLVRYDTAPVLACDRASLLHASALPGMIEVTVALAEAPQKLHVLLSEVWMHIRAENLGFTLALPRQPKRGQRIQAFALPSGTAFHFETLSLSECPGIVHGDGC